MLPTGGTARLPRGRPGARTVWHPALGAPHLTLAVGPASLCLLPCGAKGLRCHMAGATAVLDTALLPKLSMVCCVISSACVCLSLGFNLPAVYKRGI